MREWPKILGSEQVQQITIFPLEELTLAGLGIKYRPDRGSTKNPS